MSTGPKEQQTQSNWLVPVIAGTTVIAAGIIGAAIILKPSDQRVAHSSPPQSPQAQAKTQAPPPPVQLQAPQPQAPPVQPQTPQPQVPQAQPQTPQPQVPQTQPQASDLSRVELNHVGAGVEQPEGLYIASGIITYPDGAQLSADFRVFCPTSMIRPTNYVSIGADGLVEEKGEWWKEAFKPTSKAEELLIQKVCSRDWPASD